MITDKLQDIIQKFTQKSNIIKTSIVLGIFGGSLTIYNIVKKKIKKPKFAIPMIDLQNPNAAQQINTVCRNQGFFYIKNHGISNEDINLVFEESKKFFQLPVQLKLKIEATENNYHRGYTRYQAENLGKKQQGDTKEGFHIAQHADIGSYENVNFLHYGPNQWPDVNEGGKDFKKFKPAFESLHQQFINLSRKLTTLIAQSLNLNDDFFDDKFKNPMATLRVVHYHAQKSDIDKGIMGCGEHTDGGIITILKTDQEPGLQILLNDKWVDVAPIKDAFIINLGMTLQRWTNDEFKATKHRVINKTGRERYSMPFFYLPTFDAEIKCIENFITKDKPAKYPPVKFGDFFFGRFKATYLDKNKQQDKQ